MTRQNLHPGMFISYTSGLFFFQMPGARYYMKLLVVMVKSRPIVLSLKNL